MCRAHILTTLFAVFLHVGVQIFFQPSAVSTQLTFLTRLIVLKKIFPLKTNTYTGFVAVFNEMQIASNHRNATAGPGLLLEVTRFANESLPSLEEVKLKLANRNI